MPHSGRWSLVGVDMTGIELRMLAHFMYPYDGGEYAKLVLEGDVHQANADAWGVSRSIAKTGIYAMIYGAGDAKLGRTLDPEGKLFEYHNPNPRPGIRSFKISIWDETPKGQFTRIGAEKRAAIMDKFPALGKLTANVIGKARERGYLIGLDGRRLPVRSEHSALNTVLQSAAAVCSKVWLVHGSERLTEYLGPQEWGGKWAAMMWVHDEVQVAARNEDGLPEFVGGVLVESIRTSGEALKLNVPLTGEMKIGRNWSETH